MLKMNKTYTDYDGTERTEDFYFILSKPELVEMQWSIDGGLKAMIERIIAEKDNVKLFKMFKEIILKAYGEKSADGKYFNKSEELSKRFEHSAAYEAIFMDIVSDDSGKKVADFIEAILPQDIVSEQKKNGNLTPIQQNS